MNRALSYGLRLAPMHQGRAENAAFIRGCPYNDEADHPGRGDSQKMHPHRGSVAETTLRCNYLL